MPTIPGMDDFFPAPFAFEGTIFEMNRLVLVRLIVVALLVLVFGMGASRAKLIPTKGQMILESMLLFVRDQVAIETLGEKKGRQYAPILTFIFLGVFFMNITGVIPGLNIAASSVVAVPLFFAAISYCTFIYAGIREHGVGGFFRSQLFPPGVPAWIYVLLTPIEFISAFIIRPATLTVRLLCNMIAGHLMLALCFYGAHYMFTSLSAQAGIANVGYGIGTLGLFAGGVIFTLFEIFVAGLQAYIFSILTAVYIKISVEAH